VHDAVDQLAQARLALRGADAPRKYLLVTMLVALIDQKLGNSTPALLEVDRAVAPVGHDDVAAFPGDLVVGVHAGRGVDALDGEPGSLGPGRALLAAPTGSRRARSLCA
jgi:hypothetical protein